MDKMEKGSVSWSPDYKTNVDYTIGVDLAFDRNASGHYTSIMAIDGLQILGRDPADCEHEWWEDTSVTYTSDPPQRKQVCRLCGESRFVTVTITQPFPRWKRVR